MQIQKQSLRDYTVELDGKVVAWVTKEHIGYCVKATKHAGFDSVWYCRNFAEAKAEARNLCEIISQ